MGSEVKSKGLSGGTPASWQLSLERDRTLDAGPSTLWKW